MVMVREAVRGLYVAMTTPMAAGGALAADRIGPQVEALIAAGISGLVPVGGTGEATALSHAERVEVVAATVAAAAGRVPVIAGVTTPGLSDTLADGRAFLGAGADAVMVLTPYATGPTQAGIRDYYKAVADGLGAPVMLYDIPYLSGVTILPETVRDIAGDGSIFAIKASNADQVLFSRLLRLVGDDIAVMSGDEDLFALEVAQGAVGGVLATCNVLPRSWVAIFDAARAGDLATAQRLFARISAFVAAAFEEPNPGPLKAAQAIAGFDAGPVRLPNRAPSPALVERLRALLAPLLAGERA